MPREREMHDEAARQRQCSTIHIWLPLHSLLCPQGFLPLELHSLQLSLWLHLETCALRPVYPGKCPLFVTWANLGHERGAEMCQPGRLQAWSQETMWSLGSGNWFFYRFPCICNSWSLPASLAVWYGDRVLNPSIPRPTSSANACVEASPKSQVLFFPSRHFQAAPKGPWAESPLHHFPRSWRVAEMAPQTVAIGAQDMPPQNVLLWYIGYLELWALGKWQMQRKSFSLSFPYLPKDTSFKWTQVS